MEPLAPIAAHTTPPAATSPAAPSSIDARRLITVPQAARIAGVHENTMYRLIRRAQANGDPLALCVVDLPGAKLMIRRSAFERWLDATTV